MFEDSNDFRNACRGLYCYRSPVQKPYKTQLCSFNTPYDQRRRLSSLHYLYDHERNMFGYNALADYYSRFKTYAQFLYQPDETLA